MTIDLSTRPLTDGELVRLKARLREFRFQATAARALGVSVETIQGALEGKRVQCAKREKLLANPLSLAVPCVLHEKTEEAAASKTDSDGRRP
jgi:hypothetical protein